MICHRLNVSSNVHREMVEMSESVYAKILQLEHLDILPGYCNIEGRGNFEMYSMAMSDYNTMECGTWENIAAVTPSLHTYLRSIKLVNCYAVVTNFNTPIHRHQYVCDGELHPYMIALFAKSSGKLQFFETEANVDAKSPFQITDEYVAEMQRYEIQEGGIYYVGVDEWHKYTPYGKDTIVYTWTAYAKTPDEAREHIEYLESL